MGREDFGGMTNEQIFPDRYTRGRDAEAFRLLVERYQGLVYSAASRLLGRREDVEDVTQQTFLKLAQGAGSIQQNVGAWLYATAVNGAGNDLIPAGCDADAAAVSSEEVGVQRVSEGEWADVSGVIDEEIAALPGEERALIVAHFMEGESHRAIAERMGMNQSTISRRMEAAVVALRKGLMKRGYGEIGVGAVVAGLPRMAVPSAVTGELVKVGLAGAGGKATAGLMSAWKLSVLAAGVAAVVGVGVWMKACRVRARTLAAEVVAEAKGASTQVPHMSSRKMRRGRCRKTYGLAAGEELRRAAPPFPPEREALIRDNYSYIWDVGSVHSLQFVHIDGVFTEAGFSYPPMDLEGIAEDVLRINWYHVEGLAAVGWTPKTADWVSGGGLEPDVDIEKHLNALAKIASADIGKTVTFERLKQSRWCIVTKGPFHDHDAPKNREGFHPVIVSLKTPEAEELAQWQKKPPRDSRTGFQFQHVGKWMDAPCSGEGFGDMFYVMADAKLKRDDPDYKAELQQVMDNGCAGGRDLGAGGAGD